MIKENEIDLFLSLFQKSPNSSFLYIDNGCVEIHNILFNFIASIDGKMAYKEFSNIDLEKFRLTAREYEYVVVCDCFLDNFDMNKFIKTIYHSLENSANIILISKKYLNKLFLMTTLLEENDFRATNSIEIFNDYDLVVAKKMHMWGNGL